MFQVGFAAVDCTKHKEPCNAHDVQGYPTFVFFRYGKQPQKYTGNREVGEMCIWKDHACCLSF